MYQESGKPQFRSGSLVSVRKVRASDGGWRTSDQLDRITRDATPRVRSRKPRLRVVNAIRRTDRAETERRIAGIIRMGEVD